MASKTPALFRPVPEPKGCGTCKHLQPGALFTTCVVFPDGIPTCYLNGDLIHDTSMGIDQGIVWESKYEGLPALDEYLDELDRLEAVISPQPVA